MPLHRVVRGHSSSQMPFFSAQFVLLCLPHSWLPYDPPPPLAAIVFPDAHPQHFNYYAVNKGRRKSPSFYLVDVPGLGYARADDGRMDSWKSTLQRYLGVRESLRVVFHLIDGR